MSAERTPQAFVRMQNKNERLEKKVQEMQQTNAKLMQELTENRYKQKVNKHVHQLNKIGVRGIDRELFSSEFTISDE